jgi:plastocyanin domain-containing protein
LGEKKSGGKEMSWYCRYSSALAAASRKKNICISVGGGYEGSRVLLVGGRQE